MALEMQRVDGQQMRRVAKLQVGRKVEAKQRLEVKQRVEGLQGWGQ